MRIAVVISALVLSAPAVAGAAIAHVQSATGITGGASSFNITVSALTTGNVVVCQMKSSDETRTYSFSATNVTFTTVLGPITHSGAPLIRTYHVYGIVDTGGATTITVTASAGSPTMGGWCAEFSGLPTSSLLDQSGQGESAAAGTAHDITGTETTTQADELLVGGCGVGGSTGGWTVGANYTAIYIGTSASIPSGQYRIVSATGSYSTPMTSGNSIDSVCLMATYKAFVAAGGAPRFLLMGVGN